MFLREGVNNPFADLIRRVTFNEKRNVNLLVVGHTQTRKSTYSVGEACKISPRFDVLKHIAIIEPRKFLNILKTEKLFRGDVVVADDYGVGLNHRTWHSFLNKALNYTMMTFGFKGIVVIVNVPYEKYIDSDTRLLFDYEITTLAKNDKEGWVRVKIVELQHVQVGKEMRTYKRFLRMKCKDGSLKRVESFKVPYPSKDVMDKYFTLAKEAKNKLHYDLNAEAENIEKKSAKDSFSIESSTELILRDVEKFKKVWQHRPFIDSKLIMNECNIGRGRADRIRAAVEKKLGWDSNTRVD